MTIEEIVRRDFTPENQAEVLSKIGEMQTRVWGVGSEQLIRGVLWLAQGDMFRFRSQFPIIDPRDTLMAAGKKEGEDRASYFPPR